MNTTAISSGYTLRPLYPKGFAPFYMMKYEISLGQYADFLNTLTQDAMANRFDPTKTGMFRYTMGEVGRHWQPLYQIGPVTG